MCGFALIKANIEKGNLIRHRGIEKSSVPMNSICDSDKFIGLRDYYIAVHHRLPIQTIEGDEWKQPIEVDDNVWMMYNGEIFNYDTNYYENDVHYLVEFFKNINWLKFFLDSYYRRRFLLEINSWDGFWSIFLIDSKNGITVTFTDPLGKKQLYYNDDFEFASELKPLIIEDRCNYDLIFKSQIAKWGYNTNERTPYKNIKRILPNTIYLFFSGRTDLITTIPNYYSFESNNITPFRLKALLEKSVERRLLSKKYKIGVLLSGGLDSSIIATILEKRFEKTDVIYYSVDNEERKYVEILQKELGIKVNFFEYKIEDYDLYNVYVNDYEFPIDLGSCIPQLKLFENIKEKIVLSGDGADELFGGYRRIDEYDSQRSDIFDELSYFHLPRLDRASMKYTIELRNPYLGHDIIRKALKLPIEERKNKAILKKEFSNDLPPEIIFRKKHPLKNPEIVKDKIAYRFKVLEAFYGENNGRYFNV